MKTTGDVVMKMNMVDGIPLTFTRNGFTASVPINRWLVRDVADATTGTVISAALLADGRIIVADRYENEFSIRVYSQFEDVVTGGTDYFNAFLRQLAHALDIKEFQGKDVDAFFPEAN